MIIIHEYNPAWPKEFEALRSVLQAILAPLALRIDHIGSTSVPGLGAKDVIDIQVTVQALTAEVKQRLIAAGYVHFPTYSKDHVPLGEDDDPRLWVKLFFNQPAGQRRANVHVRIEGNPNQRYPLLFRDYLRAHPNSARTIELIKREIAKRHADDEDAYYDIKDPVYDLIWDAAQDRARQTGWSDKRHEILTDSYICSSWAASQPRMARLRVAPQRYSRTTPLLRITRWQGIKKPMALAPTALPTARAAAG